MTDGNIIAVEAVDRLMMQFRHKVKPTDHEIVVAYELGINVQALKQYIEEVELEEHDTDDESDWPEDEDGYDPDWPEC